LDEEFYSDSEGEPIQTDEGSSAAVGDVSHSLIYYQVNEDAEGDDDDSTPIGSILCKPVTTDPAVETLVTEVPPARVPSRKKLAYKPAPGTGSGRRKKRDLASLQLNLGKDVVMVKRARLDRGKPQRPRLLQQLSASPMMTSRRWPLLLLPLPLQALLHPLQRLSRGPPSR
jgi:hypothetical protein